MKTKSGVRGFGLWVTGTFSGLLGLLVAVCVLTQAVSGDGWIDKLRAETPKTPLSR